MIRFAKPAFPRRALFVSFSAAFFIAAGVPAAASELHSDVPVSVYADFGQNAGRFRTGSVSALLEHLNSGGVTLSYLGGQAENTLSAPTISFAGVTDSGSAAGIGVNFVATVLHVGLGASLTFSQSALGSGNAVRYSAIEYADGRKALGLGSVDYVLSDYQHTPDDATTDYKVSRLNKIVTDASLATVYTGDTTSLAGTTLYRAAGGTMEVRDHAGVSSPLADKNVYVAGGVVTADSATSAAMQDGSAGNTFSVSWQPDWSAGGVSASDPLPTASLGGDSGSPLYVWNADAREYQYLVAVWGVGGYGSTAAGATQWTQGVMDSYDRVVTSSSESATLYVSAVKNSGEAVTSTVYLAGGGEKEITRTPYSGTVTGGAEGAVEFIGVKQGVNTWKDLSGIKDKDDWYAYESATTSGDGYMNAAFPLYSNQTDSAVLTYADLYRTENLVFTAGAATTTVRLDEADVDLGIGYARFSAGTLGTAEFRLESSGGHQLNSAGFVVDKGVDLYVNLKNSSKNLFMREWRKIGDGDMHLIGNDDDFYSNHVLLNLGGSGKTYLEYDLYDNSGYAAYNVLANGGTTVVIKDTKQIFRDFTFGNGGATLDMNGNSMTWDNSVDQSVAADGFTIHALTEEAIIANAKAGTTTTLTFTQRGAQTFLGSFRDAAGAGFRFVYDGGASSSLELNGVFTDLSNAEGSGVTVKSGTLAFAGTLTVHALGSEDGTSAARLTRADDWRYADAVTDVSVESGATLRLGSHARLSGNVVVRDGGAFVMNEGVYAQNEYVEGGFVRENTYAFRDFYGLKGDVTLEGSAEMRVEFSSGTTAENVYAGKISGTGSLALDLADGALRLSGANAHTGGTTLNAGTLVLENASALGAGKSLVREGAKLVAGAEIALSSAGQSLTLVLGAAQAGENGTAVVASENGGKIVVSGAAEIYFDVSALMKSRAAGENKDLALTVAAESALAFNDENAHVGWWDETGTQWADLYDYGFSYADGVLFLTVPEPSAFGQLAGASALALCAASRRRRRKS